MKRFNKFSLYRDLTISGIFLQSGRAYGFAHFMSVCQSVCVAFPSFRLSRNNGLIDFCNCWYDV